MSRDRTQYDLAYGCFLLCGASALIIGVMSAIPMDTGAAGVLGFLVAIPLALASIVALVAGVVLSFVLWRHWPLPLLAVMTVLLVAELVLEAGPVAIYNAVPFLYGIGTLIICGIWFSVLRGRMFPDRGNK